MNLESNNEILPMLEKKAAAALAAGRLHEAAEHYSIILNISERHLAALKFMAPRARAAKDLAASELWHARLADLEPANLEARYNHAMTAFEAGSLMPALAALHTCLQVDPGFYPALLYQGLILERQGHSEAAAGPFLRAVRMAEQRPRSTLTPEILRFLGHASHAVSQQLHASITHALQPLERRHGAAPLTRIHACADMFTGKQPLERAHPLWRPGLAYIPGLPVRPFLERTELPWLAELEAQTPAILEELQGVMRSGAGLMPYINHDPQSAQAQEWKTLNRSENWSSFHFFRHGRRFEENCRQCPKTTAILDSLDLMRVPGYGPEAMFSILRPGTEIKPHYGSINGRLIVHLPLIVPENCGGLQVAEQTREWTKGQCLVFDDSFEHSAWNHSAQTRVVLILDTWNPALSPAEREGFSTLLQIAREFESRHLKPAVAQ